MSYRAGDPIRTYRITSPGPRLLYTALLLGVRIVDWLAFGIRVHGRENLRRTPRAILVSNHTLILDPGVIAHAIRPRRTYFTMLEETALVPYLGTFVRLLGAIPIPARRGARSELEAAVLSAANEVGFVHVFPEGECYHWSQELRPFRRGAFLMALRAELPVVPVTTVLHERRRLEDFLGALLRRTIRLPPRVTVVIGEPIGPRAHASAAPPARLRVSDTGGGVALLERGPRPIREEADEMAESTRQLMQATIDRAGGSKSIFRGQLPRLVGKRRDRSDRRAHPAGETGPAGIGPARIGPARIGPNRPGAC